MIFALPPTELAVHPTEGDPRNDLAGQCELYLLCDDINATLAELSAKGVRTTREVSNERWGLLTRLRLPGGAELGLYEPRHPLATQG
ncbi:MAG: VOC family protein [Dehalococcoidia bacterium]